jgi:hypothetical protein
LRRSRGEDRIAISTPIVRIGNRVREGRRQSEVWSPTGLSFLLKVIRLICRQGQPQSRTDFT